MESLLLGLLTCVAVVVSAVRAGILPTDQPVSAATVSPDWDYKYEDTDVEEQYSTPAPWSWDYKYGDTDVEEQQDDESFPVHSTPIARSWDYNDEDTDVEEPHDESFSVHSTPVPRSWDYNYEDTNVEEQYSTPAPRSWDYNYEDTNVEEQYSTPAPRSWDYNYEDTNVEQPHDDESFPVHSTPDPWSWDYKYGDTDVEQPHDDESFPDQSTPVPRSWWEEEPEQGERTETYISWDDDDPSSDKFVTTKTATHYPVEPTEFSTLASTPPADAQLVIPSNDSPKIVPRPDLGSISEASLSDHHSTPSSTEKPLSDDCILPRNKEKPHNPTPPITEKPPRDEYLTPTKSSGKPHRSTTPSTEKPLTPYKSSERPHRSTTPSTEKPAPKFSKPPRHPTPPSREKTLSDAPTSPSTAQVSGNSLQRLTTVGVEPDNKSTHGHFTPMASSPSRFTTTASVNPHSTSRTTPHRPMDMPTWPADNFRWRKPGQRKIKASDCGCPKKSKRSSATSPENATFVSFPEFAKVFIPYKAALPDELTLARGDIVTELRPLHGSRTWLKGCLRGFRGVFPSNIAKVAQSCGSTVSELPDDDDDDEVLGLCDPPSIPLLMEAGKQAPADPTVPDFTEGMPLKMEAVVEFDYSAQEVDELTIRKGDVITDIRMQSGGWWEGCLYGRRGMFPDNFVKVRDKVDPVIKDTMANNDVQLRSSSGRKCKVLFSYQPANDDELELQLNDIIDILDEVEEGWWRGKLRNRVGVFPSNFVSEITEKQTNGTPGSRKTSATQPPSLSLLRKEENHTDTGVIIGETDSPASPTGPDSGNPNALDVDIDAPTLPPKPVKELCRVLYPYDAANEDELTLKEGDIITIVTRDVQDKGWWRGELRGRIGVFPDNFVSIIPQDELPQTRRPDRPPAKVTQPVNSNRSRENIGKSTNTGSVSSTKRPTENNSKPEEKAPPVLTKKPVLPPTAKKPQLRSGMPASSNPSTPPPPPPSQAAQAAVVTALKRLSNERTVSPEQRLSDLVDGTASSRMTPPAVASGDMDFDGVERGAMLTHPTASRAKAPRRRLPTAMLNKETEQIGGMMNGNADLHDALIENNHSASEAEKENGNGPGTPGSVSSTSSGSASNRNSKEWDKHKAPWMEELKMSQAAKKTQGAKTPPAPSPSKPEPARMKTDVTDSPASPTSPEPPKNNAISYRQHSATNNMTNNNNSGSPLSTILPSSRPQSVHGEVPNRFSTSPNSGSRPLSMYEKPSPVASPAPVAGGNATVSMKQFLELVEKVSNLERHCELLTRTVTELGAQVKEEREKRFQVQQELDKLTDLVTQV